MQIRNVQPPCLHHRGTATRFYIDFVYLHVMHVTVLVIDQYTTGLIGAGRSHAPGTLRSAASAAINNKTGWDSLGR